MRLRRSPFKIFNGRTDIVVERVDRYHMWVNDCEIQIEWIASQNFYRQDRIENETFEESN